MEKWKNQSVILTSLAFSSLRFNNHQLVQLFEWPQFSSFGHNVSLEIIRLQLQKSFERLRVLSVFLVLLFGFVRVTLLETS